MDMKLELVPLPVSDIERSKLFYAEKLGFHLDYDMEPGNGMRVIQFTPPGSACSIAFGTGLGNDNPPGSVRGLHLVVPSVEEGRALLVSKGIEASDIVDMGGIKYVFFADPDNNSWAFQEIPPEMRG
jgi:catechol 2,3-dioxygenase-like lactoylglutathione lyase family enzyme